MKRIILLILSGQICLLILSGCAQNDIIDSNTSYSIDGEFPIEQFSETETTIVEMDNYFIGKILKIEETRILIETTETTVFGPAEIQMYIPCQLSNLEVKDLVEIIIKKDAIINEVYPLEESGSTLS